MSNTELLVSIDYIRLATWDMQVYLKLAGSVRRKFVGWRRSKWLQYKMERSQENVSFGLGEQRKKPHGIFEASGVDAHIFYHWLLGAHRDLLGELYCSRIDLQATKQPPEGFNYQKAYKTLLKPKQLRLSGDGNTLYIGNRESDSFWRIYDKGEGLVRVEVELKANQAKKLFRAFVGGESIAGVFTAKLQRSRVPKMLVDSYSSAGDITDLDQLPAIVPVDNLAKFNWLCSLDGLVHKLANDHDLEERMAQLISRWSDYTNADLR